MDTRIRQTAVFVVVIAIALWVIVGRTERPAHEYPGMDALPERPAQAGGLFEGWEKAMKPCIELPEGLPTRNENVAGVHLGQVFQESEDARMRHDFLPEPRLGPENARPRLNILDWASGEDIGGFFRAEIPAETSHLRLPFGVGVDISPGEKMQNTFSRLLYGQNYDSMRELSDDVMQGVLESFRFKLKIDF